MAPVLLMDFLILAFLAAVADGRKWKDPVGTSTVAVLGCWNTAVLGIPLRQTALNIEGLVHSGPSPGSYPDPEACRELPVVAYPDPHMDIEALHLQRHVGMMTRHSFDAEYRMAGTKEHTAVAYWALLWPLSGKSLVEAPGADLLVASLLHSAQVIVEMSFLRKSIRKNDLL